MCFCMQMPPSLIMVFLSSVKEFAAWQSLAILQRIEGDSDIGNREWETKEKKLTSQVAECGLLCAPHTSSRPPHETRQTRHVPGRQKHLKCAAMGEKNLRGATLYCCTRDTLLTGTYLNHVACGVSPQYIILDACNDSTYSALFTAVEPHTILVTQPYRPKKAKMLRCRMQDAQGQEPTLKTLVPCASILARNCSVKACQWCNGFADLLRKPGAQ